jgi:alanyl-tRNA synthetase
MSDKPDPAAAGPGPTERLYYDDPYLARFEAAVVERTLFEGRPALVLDRTAFYPESGGQPWDTGVIEGAAVVKVVEEDGRLLHVLDREVAADRVTGRIDWPRRFDHMQQHTGQHILSQAFYELVEGETLAFHLGEDFSTLEIGLASITDESLDRVEARANEVVWEDREVRCYYVEEEKIGEVPLRRPPKKHGLLRVVEVAGYDYSACGGTHCRRSGEVGLVKVTGQEKIRGRLRFQFLCGRRALVDYSLKNRELRRIGALFSSSWSGLAGLVEKQAAEARDLKRTAKKLEEELFSYEAAGLAAAAGGGVIVKSFEDRTPQGVRFLALSLTRQGRFCVVFGAKTEAQAHLILARHAEVGLDLRGVVPAVSAAAAFKGGGGPSLVELVTSDKDKLAEALRLAEDWVREKLGSAA